MNTVSRNLAFCAAVFATAFAAQGVDSFITGGWPVAESSVRKIPTQSPTEFLRNR